MAAFLRKYATATHIYVPVIKRGVVDYALGADWTPASGDVKVSIDGGAAANIGTLPTAVAMGNGAYWDFTIATGEVTGKKVIVTVSDSATKAVEDQAFVIETYGHASAEYQADLSAANIPANVTQLLGTAWLTPGTAGTPDVNAKLIGATAQTGADVGGIVSSGTHGNAALKTLIDAVDNFVDTEIAAIQTTLGTPAGASLAADLVVIDDFVDALESRLTAARAGYLDNINNSNLASVPAFPSNFASLGINASGHVSRVTLVDTTTTNTDMITAAGIRAAVGLSSANLDTQLTAIDDYLDTELAAVLAAVDTEVASIATAVGTTIPAQISALLTTAGTESYRADGATGSVFQLLYEIMALTGEFGITGTTKQHKKIDGSSNAFASTLDSATTPTSITRSLSA